MVYNPNPKTVFQAPTAKYAAASYWTVDNLFKTGYFEKSIKIYTFLFNDQRFVFDMSPNCTKIFTDDADKEQLYCPQEKHSDYKRGHPQLERIPPNQLDNQIA